MAKSSRSTQQFVILPARGVLGVGQQATAFKHLQVAFDTQKLPKMAAIRAGAKAAVGLPTPKLKVLDSIHEDGAKLVQMSKADALAFEALQPGMRIVPVVYFRPARAKRAAIARRAKKKSTAPTTKIQITVVSASDSKTPIKGAEVVAFTDFAQLVGASGKTNAKGIATLDFGKSKVDLERIYIYPVRDFYGLLKKNVALASGAVYKLKPIVFPVSDALDHFFGTGAASDGQGVRVGVIDTGCGPHPDLDAAIKGGENTVTGEHPSDFGDGDEHGSHVAGIIAARGTKATGRKGIAPGAEIMSFRVFAKGSDEATNFSIAKAIQKAIDTKCDLINMSLGGGDVDPAITSAIADARAAGVSVIVAAGNDDHGPVNFPASDQRTIAVAAFGRKGTFPTQTPESGDIAAPFGTDKKNGFAAFSNKGPEIGVVSTGVGIVSTVPGGYVSMGGTSMACPAVTGLAARLLGRNAAILNAPRDQKRSDAINQLIFAAASKLGFGVEYEGHGFPN
jgi:subtilisin